MTRWTVCLPLRSYRSKTAITTFKSLPASQYHTVWVLSQVARVHVESVRYHKVCEFSELLYRLLSPPPLSQLSLLCLFVSLSLCMSLDCFFDWI